MRNGPVPKNFDMASAQPDLVSVPTEVNQGKPGEQLLYLYTDLETDNLSGKYLLQIAAVTSTNLKFNVFINPQKPLALSTTGFLGIYWYQGDIYRDGLRLNSKNIVDALQAFMSWIKRLEQPVMLVFHNGFCFDSLVLTNKLVYFNIAIPSNLKYIADTLPFFRRNIKPPVIQNHKLATLASFFNIEVERSHDALSDCDTLRSICESYVKVNNIEISEIFKHNSRNFEDYISKITIGTPLPKLYKPRPKKAPKKKETSEKLSTKTESQNETK